MGGPIISEKEKVNTAVINALVRPLLTSYTFLSLLHAKTFTVFGKGWKLEFITAANSCWVLKIVQQFFFF